MCMYHEMWSMIWVNNINWSCERSCKSKPVCKLVKRSHLHDCTVACETSEVECFIHCCRITLVKVLLPVLVQSTKR